MRDPQNLMKTVFSVFAPIHWDGHKFIAIGVILTLAGFWLWNPLGWLFLLLTTFVIYFFRDPSRATPTRDGLIVAPADGKIVGVRLVTPPSELGLASTAEYTCVSIFLSVLDVHITRAPVAGYIARRVYVPGLKVNAALDKASEDNEREAMVFKTAAGQEVGVVRIAGLIARRIVAFVSEEQMVEAGERTGLIRFGSRVDVYIPGGKGILVSEGQRTIGGETVLADLQSTEVVRDVRVA
ncbi:MAG: phosphatidylserine decarboxylase [Alphaproteobacteria bacterium]